MRFPRKAKIFRGQIDAAPYAGVFFLVVIFMLLRSSLVFPPGLRIQLPEASDLPGIATPTVVVALDESGRIFFEHQIILESKLKERLAEAVQKTKSPLTLVVQADKAVTLDHWLRLNLLAREAGIYETLLATRRPLFPTPATPVTKP